METIFTTGEGTPSPTPSLADYVANGENFWEACRHLRHVQRHGSNSDDYRQQVNSLKEFLSLILHPDEEERSPLSEMWLPSNFQRREERFHNYLLWQAFTKNRDRRVHSCPVISEQILLQALYAGENEFDQKHHIFNLLVARGFPEAQACTLAKYIHLPNY